MKTVLVVAAIWTVLIGGFLLTADSVPWHMSVPVIGFLWVGGPVAYAGRARAAIGVVAFASFAAITAAFLVLTWVSLAFLAGIGSLLFELDASLGRAAAYLTSVGSAGMAGALLGAIVGSRLGRWSDSTPVTL